MTLRASVAACPARACSLLVTASLGVIASGCQSSWEESPCFGFPSTQTHFSCDSPPWVWAAHSPVHPIPLLKEQAPCVQGLFILPIAHLPPPPLLPRCSTVSPSPCKLGLEPPRTRRVTAPCFQAHGLNSCGRHYGSISPWSFFSPPAVEAETHISPPLALLLLLPAASSSSLASAMNSVNTEALSAAVVVSL